jgi:hypothetical protein
MCKRPLDAEELHKDEIVKLAKVSEHVIEYSQCACGGNTDYPGLNIYYMKNVNPLEKPEDVKNLEYFCMECNELSETAKMEGLECEMGNHVWNEKCVYFFKGECFAYCPRCKVSAKWVESNKCKVCNGEDWCVTIVDGDLEGVNYENDLYCRECTEDNDAAKPLKKTYFERCDHNLEENQEWENVSCCIHCGIYVFDFGFEE